MRKDLDSIKNATPVPLNNKFNPLTNQTEIIEVPKSKKLPPFNITLSETQTSDTVGKLVKTLSFKPVLIHKPHVKEISVHVATLNDYRALQAKLNDSDINYYVFKDPEYNPPIKVVVRNLPINSSVDEIKSELIDISFPVTNVSQMHSYKNKVKAAIPLFLITLENNEKGREIINLDSLLYYKIRIEKYARNPQTTQCFKCQKFDHVSNNCHIDPRCVKCAGPHKTSECQKERSVDASCANCGGKHTANYRGCPEYKKKTKLIQKINQKIQNPPKSKNRPPLNRENFPQLPKQNFTQFKPNYSQAYKNHFINPNSQEDTENLSDLLSNLSKLQQSATELISDSLKGKLTKVQVIERHANIMNTYMQLAIQNATFRP